MPGQIKTLTRVQLCNLFGMNEIRYTRDRKKRRNSIAFALVWLWIILLLVLFSAALGFGLVRMEMEALVPIYLYLLTSLIILVFSFLRAGSTIFQMSTYELLISLPVSRTAIVVSRFMGMYLTDLILSFLIMLPGMTVYGLMVRPGLAACIYGVLGMLLLPLLPITVAVAAGGVITAVSARMKHRSLISAALSILLATVCIVGSMKIGATPVELDQKMLENLTGELTVQIRRIYLPSIWYGEAAGGSLGHLLLLAAVSGVVFAVVISLLQKYFMKISSLLAVTHAKNDYRIRELKANPVRRALWRRELKRYLASSVYVTNTVIGYIMMDLMAAALLISNIEGMERQMGMEGVVGRFWPLALSMAAILMPISSCSISMEGKQWWITLTLPVKYRDVYLSKILVNLTVAAPFYLVAVVCALIAVKPGIWQAVWIIAVPAAYILFSSVAGVSINLLVPVFSWENEAKVVKQSASVLFSMLAGFCSVAVPAAVLLLAKEKTDLIMLFTIVMLLLLSAVLLYADQKTLPGRRA